MKPVTVDAVLQARAKAISDLRGEEGRDLFAGINAATPQAQQAQVYERARELLEQRSHKTLLSGFLRQTGRTQIWALEVLTHVRAGAPAGGPNPYIGLRWVLRHTGSTALTVKLTTRQGDAMRSAGGFASSDVNMGAPIFLYDRVMTTIQPGQEVVVDTDTAIHLLSRYGMGIGKRPHFRPIAETYPLVEVGVFDALKGETWEPRAAPVQQAATADDVAPDPVKRGRGRPRKDQSVAIDLPEFSE